MPLPAIALAGGAAALPYLLKIPKYAKMLYKSKNFIPLLMGGTYLGSELLGAAGHAGERGLSREQMKIQTLLSKASAEATKRGVVESRAKTKEYVKALMKSKREDANEARDLAALRSFQQRGDRQLALALQTMQALAGRGGVNLPTRSGGGGGMLGLMRGGF